MIKLVFALRRRPELSREEFQRYWREQHGPLVKSRAEVLRIRRYVQVHSMDASVNEQLGGSRDGPPEYDGVAELWWDSMEDYLAPGATETGRRAAAELLEDERKFIDLADSPYFLAEEHPIVE